MAVPHNTVSEFPKVATGGKKKKVGDLRSIMRRMSGKGSPPTSLNFHTGVRPHFPHSPGRALEEAFSHSFRRVCLYHQTCKPSLKNSGIQLPDFSQNQVQTRALTVTFQALANQAEEHLPTVVTEGRSSVRMHIEGMRADLEVLESGGGYGKGNKDELCKPPICSARPGFKFLHRYIAKRVAWLPTAEMTCERTGRQHLGQNVVHGHKCRWKRGILHLLRGTLLYGWRKWLLWKVSTVPPLHRLYLL